MKKKLSVFCGETVKEKSRCTHPVRAVQSAMRLMKKVSDGKVSKWRYKSNQPEFVAAVRELSVKYPDIEVEFFLNGESVGKDADPIFEDFNRCYSIIDNINPETI